MCSRRIARSHWRGRPTHRLRSVLDEAATAGVPPGKTRTRSARREARARAPRWAPAAGAACTSRQPSHSRDGCASEEGPPPGSWWPFPDDALPLPRACGELREAVHRRVVREEAFEHAREQERAAAGKVLLVEFQIDTTAAGECEALIGGYARVCRRAAH